MKQRPWRLTRRERVRMEAVLLALRSQIVRGEVDPWDIHMATRIMGDPDTLWSPKSWRAIRARLSIALRAALRADEDARCEEVRARVSSFYSEADYERSEMRGAAEDWCDSLREWPPLRSVAYEWPDGVPVPPSVLMFHVPYVGTFVLPSRVPRALWDR